MSPPIHSFYPHAEQKKDHLIGWIMVAEKKIKICIPEIYYSDEKPCIYIIELQKKGFFKTQNIR